MFLDVLICFFITAPLERGLSSTEQLDPATRDNTSLTLSPRMTPVRSPQINGRSLFANRLAVGSSPTLTWAAPGRTYIFTISALAGSSGLTQPFRNGLPFAFATMMSGIDSPQAAGFGIMAAVPPPLQS